MKLIRGRLVPKIKSLAAAGIEPATIARLCRCAPEDVAAFLSPPPPPPPDPTRPIRGVLAGEVRRLHADGRSAARIAAELALDPAAVAELLRRLDAPRPPRPGRYRPRPRAASEWGPVRGDDDLADDLATPPAPIAIDPGPDMAAQSHGPAADAAVAPEALDWGPLQGRWAAGWEVRSVEAIRRRRPPLPGSCGPTA